MCTHRLPGLTFETLGSTCNVRDVCEVLEMTAPTVRGLCREGFLVAKKRGGKWLIETQSIEKFRSE